MTPIPAALAFFAAGAVFFGTAMLLLFNPRSRSVRWFGVAQCPTLVWLLMQGWWLLASGGPGRAFYGVIHMIPACFLGFALVAGKSRPDWQAALGVAAGALFLPWAANGDAPRDQAILVTVAQVAMWITGMTLLVRSRRRDTAAPPAPRRRLGVWVAAGLMVVLPVGIIGGHLTNGASSL
ncbi:MAG TPA: hypothetical protein VF665_13520, partial [Longimicrobium sp.]|uniref:hypothetical protein n=1 Tax=Longimicrobium sp. TaxID=2029185 RepID=UPI002ED84C57